MKKKLIALLGLLLFCSHDMYLKMETYFLQPDQQATIHLYNGTFDKSENVIARDRMRHARLVGNGKSYELTNDQWSEKDSITVLNFKTGDSGTWVAGVSTKARNIEMKAEDFNDYLKHDGVLDMLEWRRENNALEKDAVESYSKHVKAIFQVGGTTTADWGTPLGYPIEFIPLSNPYEKQTGDTLKVKLLFKGAPLPNQLVYADYKTSAQGHTHDEDALGHTHEEGTDEHSHAEGAEEHTHDDDGPAHSHEAATEEHSHDDDGPAHSHAAGAEEHSHDDGGPAHSHAAVTEEHTHDDGGHSHSHEAATEEHSHDASEHGHSHENAGEDRQAHSHANAEKHEHDPRDKEEVEAHQHTGGQQLRTDQDGVLGLKLQADGIWYLRTIHLAHSEEAPLTHESNWATLTFEVVHGHKEGAESHSHAGEDGIPGYYFWILSLLVLGGLFLWFNRKNKA